MSDYARFCPRCRTRRALTEILCEGAFESQRCNWSLLEVLPTTADAEVQLSTPISAPSVPSATPSQAQRRCRNGHDLAPGDFLCLLCGESAAEVAPAFVAGSLRVAAGWELGAALPVTSGEADLFFAARAAGPERAVFKHYRRGIEPEAALYPALRELNPDHGPRLLDAGRFEERAFEVWEFVPHGSLAEISAAEKANPDFVRAAGREIGTALAGLEAVNIRHRDLKPANVLVRSREPLDLVVADFSTATFSEFDLQMTVVRQTTRYAAPETIAGTFAVSSDWWSLGVMILEMLTQGRGFEGVHERAFLLHLVTRGLRVPDDLPPDWRELLMGLLTRDPARRWRWPEVQRWLSGERGIPHGYDHDASGAAVGPPLRLGGMELRTPEAFAIAAAETAHWDAAGEMLRLGQLATWLEQRQDEKQRLAEIRAFARDESLDNEARLALTLLVLNHDLPLCCRGEIVTPNWLLNQPARAGAWLRGSLPSHLLRLKRELWLVRLRERADRVRTRLKEFDVPVDEAQLEVALLATSTTVLETEWRKRRRLFPEAGHPGLAALMERHTPSEEDLILLISTRLEAFRPADDVLAEAQREATLAGMTEFTAESARPWFEHSRRDLLNRLDERLRGFARCGRDRLDEWADAYRIERRLPLARLLVLLSVPADDWREPAQQQYVQNVLTFFHRRLVSNIQRGPLVRLTIGRNSARLDLHELGAPMQPATALLDHVLRRTGQRTALDPAALLGDPRREARLRRLVQTASTYRRDTGIHALYLGFPILVLRDVHLSDAAKPRIAPLLLWPVQVDPRAGARGVATLGFDREREEVRLNPALEFLIGAERARVWQETVNEILSRDHLRVVDVMDALGALAHVQGRSVQPMPPADVKVPAGEIHLHCAASIFLCDFSGQTMAEDLKQLAHRPVTGTALEPVIRANVGESPVVERVPEADRYFTAEADPSQQAAVFRARHAPGLVVQGPPGTGKSQTIVNIVSDCVGRGQRVLVVCQKQAALEVVRKRLEAEGLGNRLFLLEDTASDRRPALTALRSQLDSIWSALGSSVPAERASLAQRIEAIEAELDACCDAMHRRDPARPLSYLGLLDELMAVEAGDRPPVSVAALRPLLGSFDHATVAQLCDQLAPLAPVWLESGYEGSPLDVLKPFGADAAALRDFHGAFDPLFRAEQNRHELLQRHARFFKVESPEALQQWLAENETQLRGLSEIVVRQLARWSDFFRVKSGPSAAGADFISTLEAVSGRLGALDPAHHDSRLFAALSKKSESALRALAAVVPKLQSGVTLADRLNPLHHFRRWQATVLLRRAGMTVDAHSFAALERAAELEHALRAERAAVNRVRGALGLEAPAAPEILLDLRESTAVLLRVLLAVQSAAGRAFTCPASDDALEVVRNGDPGAYIAWLDACHATIALLTAKRESLARLRPAAAWFSEDWVNQQRQHIETNVDRSEWINGFHTVLPTLAAFQTFRPRAQNLNDVAFRVLAVMRASEALWRSVATDTLPVEFRRTLWREALLGWKDGLEQTCPALLMERDEFESKVRLLGELETKMREANRQLLAHAARSDALAPRKAWEEIVMLQGPRARRLREVADRGEALGLFHVRPVWLVNPEMVSRVFPLRAGLFDLVVFDEASQLPVECALPALFRAKRVVVSGDEKQLPPSSFFSSRFSSDEEETGDWLESDDTDADLSVQQQRREGANRREVKDCEDLLALAQGVLPLATLEIHYRSKFRHLVAFSNAAFYAGRLSVPARHPETEVRRARPIEVIRSDTLYQEQCNAGEAHRIVGLLRDTWLNGAPESRPTIGVVTFNLKQADLILEKIETCAESDEAFRVAYEQELQRAQDGEDMRFFVKNLENVQGDERDWIIFSTTFGRDAQGIFRRNFGVLGQQGGERRLNVAVTRAREKVVLVTSMPVAEVSSFTTGGGRRQAHFARDFLQAYLDYAHRLQDGDLAGAEGALRTIGGNSAGTTVRHAAAKGRFAGEVAEFLRRNGHQPVTGTDMDAFALDLALVDVRTGLFGLGIECDPPRHELLTAARARELWRPRVLQRSVPRLHRVWSRAWYHDRETEQRRLLNAAASLKT